MLAGAWGMIHAAADQLPESAEEILSALAAQGQRSLW
jgi:hypothetical protein